MLPSRANRPFPPPPRQVSNAISLWLGIQSPDLFFYAFLPPLLMDAALRLDFYLFKKIWPHMVRTPIARMDHTPARFSLRVQLVLIDPSDGSVKASPPRSP